MKKVILAVIAGLLLISLLGIGVYAKENSLGGAKKKVVGAANDAKEKAVEAVKEAKDKIKDAKEKIGELKDKIKEFKEKIRENKGWLEVEGKTIKVKEMSDEKKEIIAGKINAKTGLNLTAEDISNGTAGQVLRAYLSNGRYAIVKIMPDKAAETALKKLKAKCLERNCSVELKEIGEGDKKKIAYEVETEKGSKILFIFGKKMRVRAQVDAETGEIILVKKPWWAFLAKEQNNNDKEIEDEVKAEQGEKIIVCHVQAGDINKTQTITIGQAAVEAHLSHGDYRGECNSVLQNSTI